VDQQVATGEFSSFLRSRGPGALDLTKDQREALFREFLQWQKQRGSAQR
jgi:hypothetical protein